MSPALVVARKEITDHIRDTRSLLSSGMMALMGPGVVFIVSLSNRARGQDGAPVLLAMLSVFALVAAFGGAIDIAMDAAAGERERQSLVPLLLNPVSGADLAAGKAMAAAAFALTALALNAAGLLLVLRLEAPALLAARGAQINLWMTLGLAPLAGLGAAVSLVSALLCRTTKEANTALRFVVFVPMLVAMFLVFFPGWMGSDWFLVPIVGQQALISLTFTTVPVFRGILLAIITLSATWAAVRAAGRVLGRHDLLST